MAADPPPDDDPYADEPDRWAEADRAWAAKWTDEPEDEEPEEEGEPLERPSAAYRPRAASASSTTEAYGAGMRAAGPHLGLGMQIAASMAFFTGLGIAADRWMDTSPWGVLIGAALGMTGIMILVIRVANEGNKKP